MHAQAIYSGGMVNCTIQSIGTGNKTITAMVGLLNATYGLYGGAQYTVVNGATVYFTVHGY